MPHDQNDQGDQYQQQFSVLYSDALIQCQRTGADIWLMIVGDEQAGAITPQLAAALLTALTAIEQSHSSNPAGTLRISIGNSAGADINNPAESLENINAILESLWKLHAQQLRVHVTVDEGCYGGAAILLATCADEIMLGDQSQVALFGPRVLSALDNTPTPVQTPTRSFSPPEHLRVKRVGLPI